MKLKDLVPPLELCKLIPEGEFEDSAMIRCDRKPYILRREWIRKDAGRKDNVFPAPTLQEILEDLPQGVELSRDSEWFCSLDMTNEYYEKTPATAALKVWLKLKGIEA